MSSADKSPWKILIVDDEKEVHRVTKVALDDITVDDRELEFLSALSADEAKQILESEPDIALVLLDVVMESDDAGLRFVQYVRETLQNMDVRIVVRTGQAGLAPERDVVSRYEINGFYEKTQITADKLFSIVHTALHSYRDLKTLRSEIDRRKKAEEAQAKQSSTLEKLNKRLLQFANLASHDMKEPMRKMIIFSERLESRLGDKVPGEVSSFLDMIKGNARRLTTLINDLQALSSIDGEKPAMEPLDLGQVLKGVVAENNDTISESGASVEIGDLPQIEGDKSSLELVFQNLLANAIKYRRKDVPLEIRVTAQKLASSDPDKAPVWEVHFQDNGQGIGADFHEKVFNTFFRLHGKEIEGTGVGLALCKQLMELHEGDIRVESDGTSGSTFILSLPERQST